MDTLLGLYSPSTVPIALLIAPSICAALALLVIEDPKSGVIFNALIGKVNATPANSRDPAAQAMRTTGNPNMAFSRDIALYHPNNLNQITSGRISMATVLRHPPGRQSRAGRLGDRRGLGRPFVIC